MHQMRIKSRNKPYEFVVLLQRPAHSLPVFPLLLPHRLRHPPLFILRLHQVLDHPPLVVFCAPQLLLRAVGSFSRVLLVRFCFVELYQFFRLLFSSLYDQFLRFELYLLFLREGHPSCAKDELADHFVIGYVLLKKVVVHRLRVLLHGLPSINGEVHASLHGTFEALLVFLQVLGHPESIKLYFL